MKFDQEMLDDAGIGADDFLVEDLNEAQTKRLGEIAFGSAVPTPCNKYDVPPTAVITAFSRAFGSEGLDELDHAMDLLLNVPGLGSTIYSLGEGLGLADEEITDDRRYNMILAVIGFSWTRTQLGTKDHQAVWDAMQPWGEVSLREAVG